MKEKEILMYVNKMFKEGKLVTSESSEVEKVAVVRLDPEVAYTTISTDRKLVVNTGNYTSVTFSVFMSVPCPMDVTGEQQEEAYKYVANFCENRIAELRKQISG